MRMDIGTWTAWIQIILWGVAIFTFAVKLIKGHDAMPKWLPPNVALGVLIIVGMISSIVTLSRPNQKKPPELPVVPTLKSDRAQLKVFNTIVLRMQEEVAILNTSNDIGPFIEEGGNFHNAVISELSTDPVDLGIDNEDINGLLRATDSQILDYVRICGGVSPPWGLKTCSEVAFHFVKPSINMLAISLKNRLTQN
jgi:hypothetical protein